MSFDSDSPSVRPVGSQTPSAPPRADDEHPDAGDYFLAPQKRKPKKKSAVASNKCDGNAHHCIRCPNPSCKRLVSLICPKCHKGFLEDDTDSVLLVCPTCKHFEHGLQCRCGTEIRAATICEQQHHIRELEQAADSGSMLVILLTLFGTLGLLWLLIGS